MLLELTPVALIALKTSVLMAVAGATAAALARASAAHRHLVWTVALTLAAVLPFAVFFLPENAIIPVPWEAAPQYAPAAHVATTSVGAATTAPAEEPFLTIWSVLFVWAGGAIALLLRDLAAHAGLLRWRRTARADISPRWQETLADIARERRLPRGMTVLESAHVTSPCTWGALRPVLLLPLAGDAWTSTERRNAVMHEIAHIQRRDYLSALTARIACAIHWYNPLVWFGASQVHRLQERACDDVVLRQGGRPSEYAQLLMQLAGQGNSGPASAAVGMSSALKGRVVAILDTKSARVEPGVYVIVGVLGVLSVLMLFIATASAAPREEARSWVMRSAVASMHSTAMPGPDASDETDKVNVVRVAMTTTSGEDDADDSAGDESGMDEDESDPAMASVEADDSEDMDSDESDDSSEPEIMPDMEDPSGMPDVEEMARAADVHITIPQPPRIVVHHRRMVVHVPAVPAVNTPDIPGQRMVITVPTGRIHRNGEMEMRRQVIRIPAVKGVHVRGIPARNIVVNVPVVRAVPAVPAVPAVHAVPRVAPAPRAPHAPHAVRAPRVMPAPPTPPTPPEPPVSEDE